METGPKEKLIARIIRKDWLHIPPSDPQASQLCGMFLASTFREAEFWGRFLDTPIRVNIGNPLIGDEDAIQTELYVIPPQYPGDDSSRLLEWRWRLDAKLNEAALTKEYDAIVLLSSNGYAKPAGKFKQLDIGQTN